MKKIFLASIFALLCLLPLGVLANETEEIPVTIDGERVVFSNQQPVLLDSRVLVPVRGVFEHLGFLPIWDDESQTATLQRDDYVVVITIGSDVFTTNGEEFMLDVYARLINGSTMLPLRAVLESVGYTLTWDDATARVFITGGRSDSEIKEPKHELIGAWAWHGLIYYVFRETGEGLLMGREITWWTEENILHICTTPGLCGDECIATISGSYAISDGELAVTIDGVTVTYTKAFMADDRTITQDLIGTWLVLNGESFIFNQDGTGLINNIPIYWWTNNNVLYVCITPEDCGDYCLAPGTSFYLIENNYLHIESTGFGIRFSAIRQ